MLHPNRANVSKEDLRAKLAETYKVNKDQVSVFGFRTQYGGGKSTGFALIYDSHEALKKFEPHYRLVRYGIASKIEKPSRQQRTYSLLNRPITSIIMVDSFVSSFWEFRGLTLWCYFDKRRQATQKPSKDCAGNGQNKGWCQGQGKEEVKPSISFCCRLCPGKKGTVSGVAALSCLSCGIMICVAHLRRDIVKSSQKLSPPFQKTHNLQLLAFVKP